MEFEWDYKIKKSFHFLMKSQQIILLLKFIFSERDQCEIVVIYNLPKFLLPLQNNLSIPNYQWAQTHLRP